MHTTTTMAHITVQCSKLQYIHEDRAIDDITVHHRTPHHQPRTARLKKNSSRVSIVSVPWVFGDEFK